MPEAPNGGDLEPEPPKQGAALFNTVKAPTSITVHHLKKYFNFSVHRYPLNLNCVHCAGGRRQAEGSHLYRVPDRLHPLLLPQAQRNTGHTLIRSCFRRLNGTQVTHSSVLVAKTSVFCCPSWYPRVFFRAVDPDPHSFSFLDPGGKYFKIKTEIMQLNC